jgi:subtilisin family serine protease
MNIIKKKIKVCTMLVACLLVATPNFDMFVVKAAEDDKEIDLLLDENANILDVTDAIKDINPDIQITKYTEVSLLHLELPKAVSKDDIVANKDVKSEIELVGNIPDIEIGRRDLGATYSGEGIIGGHQTYSTQRMSDETIFDLMGWHVNEVTEERRSLEISTGEGVKIALIDSGVDYNHPVLAGSINLTNAQSFVTGDSSVSDTNGHGTMVAGIIKQVAPSAIITPYRVIGDSSGDSLWTISAFIEAVNDGNDIINASIGTYKCKDIQSEKLTIKTFERAIKFAKKNNVLVVASSGNLGLNLDQYYKTEHIKHLPGGIKDVNAISAVVNKQLTSYSNYGSNIQYCAPGGDLIYVDGNLDLSSLIYCLYPTSLDNELSSIGIPQGYTFSYGTSLSAPMVSAGSADVLSYYKSKYKNVKSKDVKMALAKGAIDLGNKGKDSYYGEGEINLYNSLISASCR